LTVNSMGLLPVSMVQELAASMRPNDQEHISLTLSLNVTWGVHMGACIEH